MVEPATALVLPSTTTTTTPVEPALRLYVVPEMVSAGPLGVSVAPGARGWSVVPSMRVGVRVWLFSVRRGAGVVRPAGRVDVAPLMMMTGAEPVAGKGRERVVPESVRAGPPGERVVPGARTKAPVGWR